MRSWKMNSNFCELVERLRNENIDQFYTLVRMHLSFVVDINTDDVDNSTDKQKQFKWGFTKKAKGLMSTPTQLNNINNVNKFSTTCDSITEEGIEKLYEIIEFLSLDENVKQEGIFRRTGSLSRQQELKQILMSGASLRLSDGKFTVHDCASVLKGFLAELPEPLLMEQYYSIYCTLCAQYPPNNTTSEDKLLTALQLLLLMLSPLHRTFLQRLLQLLSLVSEHEASNRMSPDTLATMFTPHLLCSRKLSPESLHTDAVSLSPVISFMIRQCDKLFTTPVKLSADISAYIHSREKKRLLSPNIDLDESITDRTAANTIFSFVDRRRTTAENESNPTDTALAQLYAHIQSLPESQNKRKLIKQFNRQNGYGTPIQIQRNNKSITTKSLGESIKRHIFQKSLLNKTPKKSSDSPVNDEKLVKPQTSEQKLSNQVSHKSVVMKNFVNKLNCDAEKFYDRDNNSDTTENSAHSDNSLQMDTPKLRTKFVSEPNLSYTENTTPKNVESKRLFRSKVILNSHNRRYLPKKKEYKGTPTSTVTNYDHPDSEENSTHESDSKDSLDETPTSSQTRQKVEEILNSEAYSKYLTSTPGPCIDTVDCSTPRTFRRASMSPITKSTQKLSKAMQESIMTPRSRQPLVITSEQMDNSMMHDKKSESVGTAYASVSPKNDSDFVSSDESARISEHTPDSEIERIQNLKNDYKNYESLTDPFREYLMGRSVLTASPIDLSFANKSTDIFNNSADKISDSLIYCLDGNIPEERPNSRLALVNMNLCSVETESPNRKRSAEKISGKEENLAEVVEKKKSTNLLDKENCFPTEENKWETDL